MDKVVGYRLSKSAAATLAASSSSNCALNRLSMTRVNIASDPARVPGGLMRGQYGAPTQRTTARQRSAGRRSGVVLRRITSCYREEAIKFRRLVPTAN